MTDKSKNTASQVWQQKYRYRDYNPSYPVLFTAEMGTIRNLAEAELEIEHVGSSSVPGLGGKAVIDIAIKAADTSIADAALLKAGYEYRPTGGTKRRLFYQRIENEIRFHAHVFAQGDPEFAEMVLFRNFLRAHPDYVAKYAEAKKQGSAATKNLGSKEEMKQEYMRIKQPVIDEILKQING